MKEKIIYLHNKIIGLSSTKLIALMLMLKIIITIIVLPLFSIFPYDQNVLDTFDFTILYQNINLFQILYFLFNICILTPLIETLIMQTMVIRIIMRIFKNKSKMYLIILSIIVSSSLFGIGHLFLHANWVKVLQVFLTGTISAYAYIVSYFNKRKATLCVATIHGLFNFSVILFVYIMYLV